MKELLSQSILAALAAGKEILEVYETKFEVEYKDDRSPLTLADKKANDKIIELLSHFNIPFLTEETVETEYAIRKNWTRLWIVDPLDGTKEFVKRNGEFTVNIALIESGKPILGVIYSPVLKDLYYAAKGIGSFKLDKHDLIALENSNSLNFETIEKKAVKLPVAHTREKYTVVASRSHLSTETYAHIEELKKNYGEIEMINTGSSIKICLVAEGKADEYPRYGPTMEWDTAAGNAIVEFAGKKIIDLDTGDAMKYNREHIRNGSFIVK
ncbi:MAG: 3'(2'),5'-bisphosphate nucleotidase CysQ [Bacteroidia bacterium]|nr:3'(2'),5'-bisphosphate nucleotidase CysQ [Bacteroidia bacterium]